jgi:hypothetical protein
MPRLAQIKIATDVLRMLLDLPAHLKIVEVIQSPDDSINRAFSLVVTGPYCPECKEGEPMSELTLRYRKLDVMESELETIVGLDT